MNTPKSTPKSPDCPGWPTNHARAQRSLPARLAGLEDRIARLTAAADWLQDVDAARGRHPRRPLRYTLPDGTRLDDRRDAGTWLRDTLARLPIGDDTWTPVGSLGGLDWEATRGRQYPSTLVRGAHRRRPPRRPMERRRALRRAPPTR